ncbi:FecR family protein [Sphingobacterium sp. LRF_L2]|uniref:FecR family protein n=1 Tax=Sphingobacterium sp. LRF_L2 TaxID=3369421 RepID=UPI003F63DEA6
MNNIPENIKFLILKRKENTITVDEQQVLDNWYDEELPDQLSWYGESEDELKDRLFSRIEMQLEPVEAVVPMYLPYRRMMVAISAAAALFLLYFLSTHYFSDDFQSTTEMFTAKSSGKNVTKVILSDQTIVWLKGDSKISYPESFTGHTREVQLDGEALFEVAKDKTRPFIVHAGDYKMKVLGTSFNLKVSKADGQLDLAVLTGIVEVSKKEMGLGTRSAKVLVEANESLRTSKESPVKEELKLPVTAVINLTDGTEYDMNFVSTPVEEIMKRFEKKFNVEFSGYTGEYKSCKVTADLTDQSLETSLKLLSLSINANFQIDDTTIKLTGGGCF